MKFLLLAPVLLTLASPASWAMTDKVIGQASLDLDGDGKKDQVRLIDEGRSFYRLEFSLSKTGKTLISRNLVPAPERQGLWSADPFYSVKAGEKNSVQVSFGAGDTTPGGYQSEKHFNYSFAVSDGKVILLNLHKHEDSWAIADPGYLQESDFDFVTRRISVTTDEHHNEYHDKHSKSDELPAGCDATLAQVSYHSPIPLCAAQEEAFLVTEMTSPERVSCPALHGAYDCRSVPPPGEFQRKKIILMVMADNAGNFTKFSLQPDYYNSSTAYVADGVTRDLDDSSKQTNTCRRAELELRKDEYEPGDAEGAPKKLYFTETTTFRQLDLTGDRFQWLVEGHRIDGTYKKYEQYLCVRMEGRR